MASKAAEVQMQIRQNSEELTDFLKDLNRWQDSAKTEDENLKLERKIDRKNVPPVRQSKLPVKDKSKKKKGKATEKKSTEKSERISSYDYDAWSRFDVDEACKDVDENGADSSEEEEDDEMEMERIQEERLLQQAMMEKEKGNQLFKEGKYEAAINRYTAAVGLDTTNPILYANRGMALIKVDRFGAAIEDCTTALKYDPTYTKALARRATARQKLKQYDVAKEDYERLLELEPKNKQAISELQKIAQTMEKLKVQKPAEMNYSKQAANIAPEKRKIRSKKPLRRVPIEEVGIEETPNDYAAPNVVTNGTSPLKEKKTSLESRVPDLHTSSPPEKQPLQIPISSFQFETTFKKVRGNVEDLYSYLKMIPTNQYSKLFTQCLDGLISPFINCLLTCYLRDNLGYHEELTSLSCVPRFSMAAMFLSNKDKQALIKLLKHMNTDSYPVTIEVSVITDLAKKYGIDL